MLETINDICNNYAFNFLSNVDNPVIKLVNVGREIRRSKKYYWDNQERFSGYIFQYTLNGGGTLKTENQIYTMKKGDAFFIATPSDTTYYFDENNEETEWEFIYITFEGKAVLPYYQYVINRLNNVMHLSEYHPAVKLLFDLYDKAKNGLIKNTFSADSEAFRFLCLLCDNEINFDTMSNLINNAKKYIDKNYSKPISLAQTAKYLGVSQSHLSREFVKYTGENPIYYLTKVRLEKSVELLNSTDMNLSDISEACGFSNDNYFSKVFKKHMKISPSEFRKQIRTQNYICVKV